MILHRQYLRNEAGQVTISLPLTSNLRQGKTLKRSQAHDIVVALQSIGEMLELSLCRYRLATEHRLEVPVNILLGELIRKLADVYNCLVEGVTVVSDRTLSIVGNSQLALKNGNAIWKSRSLLYRHVGDLLRHKISVNGVLTAWSTRPAVPQSTLIYNEKMKY